MLDACGGSASVSYLLKKMNKQVTFNDKLHFNYLIGKALIENNRYKLTEEDITNLFNNNPQLNYRSIISEMFQGIYYLDEENQWLDTVCNNIVNMNHYRNNVLQYKRSLSFYALFQASLVKRPFNLFHRANLDIRTNDVDRNFGNKTTWETPFPDHFMKFAHEANSLIFKSRHNCISTNLSVFDVDPYGLDLVYFDLPYIRKDGNNESSNYLKCYHFLEGLSKYNQWPDLIDFNTANLRLQAVREQNDFTKQNMLQQVEGLFYKFRHSKIVFSYKVGGIPSIPFIVKTMKKFKKHVYTKSLHYTYALNHQNGDAKKNREVIIIGK